jgi:hypothetical protein
MDPNETVRLIIRAYARGDERGVRELVSDLSGWLGRGGFKPRNIMDLPAPVREQLRIVGV